MIFPLAEKLTTNSMDTALNKIDCIFAVFLTSLTSALLLLFIISSSTIDEVSSIALSWKRVITLDIIYNMELPMSTRIFQQGHLVL